MMNVLRRLLLLSLCCWAQAQNSLVSLINNRTTSDKDPGGLSLFSTALQATGMLDALLGNASQRLTVFAPTNAAIKASPQFLLYLKGLNAKPVPRWHEHVIAALRQHILVDQVLTSSNIFDLKLTQLNSMQDPISISQFGNTVQNAVITEANITASNGVLHVVSAVIQPKFFTQPFSQLELQQELGPDYLGRTSLVDVVDFVGGRETLNTINQQGTTFVGCRVRAFNRLNEYRPQTMNGSPDGVIKGEFLNATYKAKTLKTFIDYSMIPKNYYGEDIYDGFMELIVPTSKCGHMWVTKNQGQLCFNDGCVVTDPDPREYLAGNGVGYVIDKCLVCPGVAMLTDVASVYTVYNLKDTAQFFTASGWNLRDLRRSVGDGSPVTLFASINDGWNVFNMDDINRLAGEEWKPHQIDLLSNMLVQGYYTYQDLQARFNKTGAYNLTTLINQTILIDFDSVKNTLSAAGGDIFFPNIQGVDGVVHFNTRLPLPRSATMTVYDMAKVDPNFSTQIAYIDSVFLDGDMKRLLPLTALYAPNPEWEGKQVEMNNIAKGVLENMMFGTLLWCDKLRNMTGTSVTSVNEKNWTITINDKKFPCFETLGQSTGTPPMKACITKCDILALNGIVHELDTLLLSETATTGPPSAFSATNSGSSGSNTSTSGGQQPQSSPTVFYRQSAPGVNAPGAAPSVKAGSKSGAISQSLVVATAAVLLLTSLI